MRIFPQQESTRLTSGIPGGADYLVTVCGHADVYCPVLPAGTREAHWPPVDPARATGNEEHIMQVFRATRDAVQRRVREPIQRPQEQGQ